MKKENRGGARTSLTKKIGRPEEGAKTVLFRRVPSAIYSELAEYVDSAVKKYKASFF